MNRLRCGVCGNLVWFDVRRDETVTAIRIGVGGRVHVTTSNTPAAHGPRPMGRMAHIDLTTADGFSCRKCGDRTSVDLL